jgi:hypothetical protein
MHRAALAMSPEDLDPILKAFGKGLVELIPVLKTDFDKLEQKMRVFGLIMDTETIAKLKVFSNSLEIFANVLTTYFAPLLLKIIDRLMDGTGRFLDWMDKRARPDPEAANPESKGGFWALNARVGTGIVGGAMGGITGVLGLWNEAIGQSAKAEDRLIQAMDWFKFGGLSGGYMDQAADQMVKNANEGKPTLKQLWDNTTEELRKDAAALAERLKNPVVPDYNVNKVPGKEPKEKAPRAYHESGDALIRVGNFLGSSKDVLEDIGQRQVQLLQQIAANTKPAPAGSGGMSDYDFTR